MTEAITGNAYRPLKIRNKPWALRLGQLAEAKFLANAKRPNITDQIMHRVDGSEIYTR